MSERNLIRGGIPIACLAQRELFAQEVDFRRSLSADAPDPVRRFTIEIVPDSAGSERAGSERAASDAADPERAGSGESAPRPGPAPSDRTEASGAPA